MVKILLVNGHPLIRELLKKRIELEPDLKVVGEAEDAPEAVKGALFSGPDVIVLDMDIPGAERIETTRQLHLLAPGIPIIIMSLNDDEALRQRVLKVGAVNLVAKEGDANILMMAIRKAAGEGA